METRHFILATAGHVDHGKSALVRTLTGTDPDRLPEEKRRGITIDLGFARCVLPSPTEPNVVFQLGIVDVPGHEDFIKNMVAGVGAVDVALLVVAADDGWMPQTEEHLRILEYLGVRRAVVALTKADLLPTEAARATARERVRGQLVGGALADAPVVPVSTVTGEGLGEIRAALAGVLASASPPRDVGKPRLPLDRVFTLRGIGTVVTGTLRGGVLGRGQTVVVQPGGQTARVRAVQSHRRETEVGRPGSRVALNLPDLPADPAVPGAPRRGDVVTLADLGSGAAATDTLDALLVRSGRAVSPGAAPALPLRSGLGVRVHLGSAHHAARVFLLDAPTLAPGERVLAQLRFGAPVCAFAGDRFVVRDASGRATLAGGLVLDPHAGRRGFHTDARRAFLGARAAGPDDVGVFLTTELSRTRVARHDGLLVPSGFSAVEIADALRRLADAGRVFLTPTLAADGPWWEALRTRAAALVDAEHTAHPERAGLPLIRLRAALTGTHGLPAAAAPVVPVVFEALTADLRTRGFAPSDVCIRRQSHRPVLPPRLQAAGERVRAALAAKPFEPPSRAALAPDASAQAALRFLLETGEAVELNAETVVLAGGFARMRATVVRHLREQGPATASELRQSLQTTRRIVVPLLERLDREGVTRREGDCRVLPKTGDAARSE